MEAWVTLTTNDSYSVGALALASSIRRVGTTRQLVCMVTNGVGSNMLEALRKKFDQVVSVEEMDSGDAENLRLLDRHDLGVTFTKISCWTLTQYSKCVFLDADTMLLGSADELFDREEFSAAPDAGWPDCFNSGVFVFKPSLETYSAILKHAADTGSFDGGDQGLLNTFFCDWSTKDISKHLPFIYNMVASASYSYLPAYKRFGQNVKIIHFIGATKPWLVAFDSQGEPLVGNTESHTKNHLQLWWQIFSTEVKPLLTVSGGAGGDKMDYPFLKVAVGSTYSSHPPPPPPPGPQPDNRGDWEKGSPDFTGTAAFSNILKKMDETMSTKK
jgi:glycogenin glucosyltransferase